MLPLAEHGSSKHYQDTVVGMLQALNHGKPMVEGYSGFFPNRIRALRKRLKGFPDDFSIDYLKSLDVGYVVVSKDWLNSTLRKEAAKRSELEEV